MIGSRYEHLLAYAAHRLLDSDHRLLHLDPANPQHGFIAASVAELRDHGLASYGPARVDGPAYDFVDLLADWGPDVRPDIQLWTRLMHEWPMGEYAAFLALYLGRQRLLERKPRVLEVGAGVGNLTVYLREHSFHEYVRADLYPKLLELTDARSANVAWDFDEEWPHPFDEFDLIVAANALHCAADPRATVARLVSLLAPGGSIVVAEGAPYTPAPWALTAPFGLMDGWWDRGGFRTEAQWAGVGLPVARGLSEHRGHSVGYILHHRKAS